MVDDLTSGNAQAVGPDFGILLLLAARAYADDLHARLASVGFPEMRASFGFIFRVLRESQPTPSELAVQLGVSKQAVGKVLDEMEARGFVVRQADRQDRRARRVVLTDHGRAASDAAIRFSDEIEADLRVKVGAEQVSVLRTALLAYVQAHGGDDHADARRARPIW
jgi:DNA-binding MarR family transcriptional regulator